MIRLALLMYVRFPLSLCNVEDLLDGVLVIGPEAVRIEEPSLVDDSLRIHMQGSEGPRPCQGSRSPSKVSASADKA